MYLWIWKKLPGNYWAKVAASILLILGLITLLFLVVFPALDTFFAQDPTLG
ncbi:MAG: hypothetical protein RL068_964 [Actinomycetota bacterium]|jgi:hypothetical protein